MMHPCADFSKCDVSTLLTAHIPGIMKAKYNAWQLLNYQNDLFPKRSMLKYSTQCHTENSCLATIVEAMLWFY